MGDKQLDDRTLARELGAIVGERHVLTDPSELVAYECDGNTLFKGIPRAVVLPGSTEEVVRLVMGHHMVPLNAIGQAECAVLLLTGFGVTPLHLVLTGTIRLDLLRLRGAEGNLPAPARRSVER